MRFMFVLLTSLCLWPSVLIAEDPPSQIGKFFLPAKEAASKVTTTTRVAIVEIRGEMQRTSTELGAGYQMHYTGGPSPNYGSPGAEITMLVKGASWLGYRFNPEPPLPLVFKLVADKGLVYLSGTGEVTDSAGKSYQFGEDMRVDRCIRGLQSTDPLIREGAAQALGYLARSIHGQTTYIGC